MKESIFPAATHHPPSLNQGRGNGASWLLRGFIFDLEGWASAVPFYILSKITILDNIDEKSLSSDSVRSTCSKSTKYPVQTIIIDVLDKKGTSF